MSLTSMVAVVTLAGMVAAPCARAAPDPFEVEVADGRAPRESGNELMAQGEAYRAAGNHVEAARAYAAAFDALAQRARPDADERLAFNLAVDELVLAQEADPENLALLEEEVALIERHEARHGAVSPGLAKELARVTDRLEELQPKEETASAEPTEHAPGPEAGVDDDDPLALPPYPPAPPSGKHLVRAGIIITSSAVLLRGASALNCVSNDADAAVDCDIGLLYGVTYGAIGTLVGMGLLGGGAARRGKRLAHGDVLRGGTSITPREQLGWGLFGVGTAWWVISRGIALAILFGGTRADGPASIMDGVGWFTSVPVAAVGLALALHGRAYRKNRTKFEQHHRPKVVMQPSLSLFPGGGTVVVSGRF
ncbi:hypothetical protein [Paraliomyxa miuraensis]|uniref:hypothetical protein n=1 Tax=Paraliomyxa miuraensis TaxID=376150 RepID=UPI0022548B79|nr:hypothetical protein [Paraliomyxa miuraensis]MCX4240514.1 hypothetical protein [Paraliomyxa miuraensis]